MMYVKFKSFTTMTYKEMQRLEKDFSRASQ